MISPFKSLCFNSLSSIGSLQLFRHASVSDGGHDRQLQRTLLILKPDLLRRTDFELQRTEIRRLLEDAGLQVMHQRRSLWPRDLAVRFYAQHQGRFFYPRLIFAMTGGDSEAWVIEGPDAVATWRRLMGPTHVNRAKREAPTTVRGRLSFSDTKNVAHGSATVEEAREEIALLFGPEHSVAGARVLVQGLAES